MSYIKGWSRVDWGTWALPLYVTHFCWGVVGLNRESARHLISVRILCFGFFVEWSR